MTQLDLPRQYLTELVALLRAHVVLRDPSRETNS